MHLVDGVAGLVEELQAEALLVAIRSWSRRSHAPSAREDAQVDVLAEHDRGLRAGLDVFEDADLLVHGAFVARQRHDFAEVGRRVRGNGWRLPSMRMAVMPTSAATRAASEMPS